MNSEIKFKTSYKDGDDQIYKGELNLVFDGESFVGVESSDWGGSWEVRGYRQKDDVLMGTYHRVETGEALGVFLLRKKIGAFIGEYIGLSDDDSMISGTYTWERITESVRNYSLKYEEGGIGSLEMTVRSDGKISGIQKFPNDSVLYVEAETIGNESCSGNLRVPSNNEIAGTFTIIGNKGVYSLRAEDESSETRVSGYTLEVNANDGAK